MSAPHWLFDLNDKPIGDTAKTWTYTPTMSVTIPAGLGIRVALRLLRDSLVALVRRDNVTFEAGESAPHTVVTIEYGDFEDEA